MKIVYVSFVDLDAKIGGADHILQQQSKRLNHSTVSPRPLKDSYQSAVGRAYSYGAGIGRVWRKHDYPLWLVAYYLLRPAGGAFLSLISARLGKAHYHWSGFRGRIRGWYYGK